MRDNSGIAMPQLGAIVAQKYQLIRELGEGGMAVVFQATHIKLNQAVALKMLDPSLAKSKTVVARFEREARAAASLKSAHVAKVIDVDVTEQGLPFMVMELLHGNDLAEELKRRGPLPYWEVVGYLLHACAAMSEAHLAGIVHRDLKPSNLFLCKDAAGSFIKVLDFGISKMDTYNESDPTGEESRMTSTFTAMGTAMYMSPEHVRSTKHVDHRTDIWSLGVILYELITGRLPFSGDAATAIAAAIVADTPESLAKLCPHVPGELVQVVERAMHKDRELRFQTMSEFARALRPFAASVREAIPSPTTGASAPTLQPSVSVAKSSVDAMASAPTNLALKPITEGNWAVQQTDPGTRAWKYMLLAGVAGLFALVVGVVGWKLGSNKGASSSNSGISSVSAIPSASDGENQDPSKQPSPASSVSVSMVSSANLKPNADPSTNSSGTTTPPSGTAAPVKTTPTAAVVPRTNTPPRPPLPPSPPATATPTATVKKSNPKYL
jgi:eukaryotic-like serine/threonine-protein kinase